MRLLNSGIVLFFAICRTACLAVVYHVSPVGDDSAAGDAGHPVRTISHAAELAGPGDVVLIGPGVYREWVAVTKSGTVEKPITFQAEKVGTAVISGADPITVWVPVPEHPGQFISDWPYDFVVGRMADGSPVRNYGAPPPMGCAEQVLWESHPLRQVMKPDDLSPGSFWVDWQFHTVTAWLPGGLDARSARIEGCARAFLMSPLEKENVFSDARNITLRGLVFRNAANFAQRGGVVLGTGWHADHCTVEDNNAGGMILNGDNILVDHCIAQYNGFCGISGSGNNNTIQDCIVRGNNRKGFSPGWDGGGGKFTNTRHLRVIRHSSYENTGPGIWLDGDNSNYSITDSTFYGNRGLNDDREGCGICLENSPGPGVVSGNNIYSNTGAGILVAESQHVSVESNVLVDNAEGVELRGKNQLRYIVVMHNRFKEWRKEAIAAGSVVKKGIGIDQNFYDPPGDRAFVVWGDAAVAGLPEMRSVLGMEERGSIEAIEFAHSLENIRTVADADRPTIAKALKDATEGGTLTIPVNSRSPVLDDDSCAVFDWDNSCVAVALPTEELRRRMEDAVSITPTGVGVLIEVRIDRVGPHGDVRGTLVEIK
jgi:hypothetical protein